MTNESSAYLLHKLVFELDRGADSLLRAQMGISYKRAVFLLVLEQCGTVTQHELAIALGYSDPSVSTMLVELAKEGYLQVAVSPEHARKRLVSITAKGSEGVAQGRKLLDAHFGQLLQAAGVDAQHYHDLNERIYLALAARMKKGRS